MAPAKVRIREALRAAAILRGSKPDRDTLTLYSNRLAIVENEEDVLSALGTLAELPRKEYETAIPEIGTLLAMVENASLARKNRETFDNAKELFYFTCDFCGFSQSGYFVPSDPQVKKRICPSHYGPVRSRTFLRAGTICGHDMRIELFEGCQDAIAC